MIMDKIKELEKQIKEIQETTEKKVKELQESIVKIKEENNKIQREKWYTCIDVNPEGEFCLYEYSDGLTTEKYDNWNYFLSAVNASNFLNTLNELKELQHYHDIYCPEYVPDWNNTNEEKWYIIFSTSTKKYCYDCAFNVYRTTIYFDSEETAEKVCDELNKEL